MTPRRIVTGQRDDGRSYIARDEACERATSATGDAAVAVHPVWASDRLPATFPFDGRSAPVRQEPGAERTPQALRETALDPGDDPRAVRSAVLLWPADGTIHDAPAHGAFEVIAPFAGTLEVATGDGARTVLRPGDVLVQHAPGSAPVRARDGAAAFSFRLGVAHATSVTDRGPIALARDRSAGGPWRVVTGQRADGTSFLARIDRVTADVPVKAGGEPATAGRVDVHSMWAHDRLPVTLPFDGLAAPIDGDPPPERTDEALQTVRRQPPGPRALRVAVARYLPIPGGFDGPWHGNDSFDFLGIIDGELDLELDGGDRTTLRRGDAVIQHGSRHRWCWSDRGGGATLLVVKLGAVRRAGSVLHRRS